MTQGFQKVSGVQGPVVGSAQDYAQAGAGFSNAEMQAAMAASQGASTEAGDHASGAEATGPGMSSSGAGGGFAAEAPPINPRDALRLMRMGGGNDLMKTAIAGANRTGSPPVSRFGAVVERFGLKPDDVDVAPVGRGGAKTDMATGRVTVDPAVAAGIEAGNRGAVEKLAHEAVHVNQADGGLASGAPKELATQEAGSDPAEMEAHAQEASLASQVLAGGAANVQAHEGPAAGVHHFDPTTAVSTSPATTASATATTATGTCTSTPESVRNKIQNQATVLGQNNASLIRDMGDDMKDQIAKVPDMHEFDVTLRLLAVELLTSALNTVIDAASGAVSGYVGQAIDAIVSGELGGDEKTADQIKIEELGYDPANVPEGELVPPHEMGVIADYGTGGSAAATTTTAPAPTTAAPPTTKTPGEVAVEKVQAMTMTATAMTAATLRLKTSMALALKNMALSGTPLQVDENFVENLFAALGENFNISMGALADSAMDLEDIAQLVALYTQLKHLASDDWGTTKTALRAAMGMAVLNACAAKTTSENAMSSSQQMNAAFTINLTYASLDAEAPVSISIPAADVETVAAIAATPGALKKLPVSIVLQKTLFGLIDIGTSTLATFPAGSLDPMNAKINLPMINIDHNGAGKIEDYAKLIELVAGYEKAEEYRDAANAYFDLYNHPIGDLQGDEVKAEYAAGLEKYRSLMVGFNPVIEQGGRTLLAKMLSGVNLDEATLMSLVQSKGVGQIEGVATQAP